MSFSAYLMNMSRSLRNLALEKYPSEEPLIVGTEPYYRIMSHPEITFATINAPYGTGKTVGVGLKAYHDSRINRDFLANAYVILLRARLMKTDAEALWQYIHSHPPERLLCGGSIVTALHAVANDPGCYDPAKRHCYTTIPKEKIPIIKSLLESHKLGAILTKCPMPDKLVEFMSELRRVLGRELVVIYDEFEGVAELLPDLPELVISNAAVARYLYDQGVRSKLVFLIQSKSIEPYWIEITNILEREEAGRIVRCPCAGRELQLPLHAVAGVTVARKMEYYDEGVYLVYMTELYRRAARKLMAEDRGRSSALVSLLKELADSINPLGEGGGSSLARRLRTLRAVAPRIAFDYVDEIAAFLANEIIYSGSLKRDRLEEALKKAFLSLSRKWILGSDIKKYYSYIMMGIDPVEKKVIPKSAIEAVVKTLASDVFGLCQNASSLCLSDKLSYHSLHTGIVIEARPTASGIAVESAILLLRSSKSAPRLTAYTQRGRGRSRRSSPATRIAALYQTMLVSLLQTHSDTVSALRGRITINLHVRGLVREGSPPEARLVLANLGNEIVRNARQGLEAVRQNLRVMLGQGGRGPQTTLLIGEPVRIYDLTDEDFIIAVVRSAGGLRGISAEKEFVTERYNDLLSRLR
jgi:hypothetical protein